jgi:hypothetical protein
MMSITPFLHGMNFDPETTRIMGVPLEMVCITLRTGDCDDDVKEAIAKKVIALAKAGERNPDKSRTALHSVCECFVGNTSIRTLPPFAERDVMEWLVGASVGPRS